MTLAAVCSKAVVPLLLLIYCLLLLLLFVEFGLGPLFCYEDICVLSNFAIISLMRKRKLVDLCLSVS